MSFTLTRPRRALAAVVAALAVLAGGWATTTEKASALQPNTVYFSTLAKCQAAKPLYSGSFTRITQGCTYAGSYFLGFKLDSGPYFLVYTTRSR